MLIIGYCAAYTVFSVHDVTNNGWYYVTAGLASLMLLMPFVIMIIFIKSIFHNEASSKWDILPSAIIQLLRTLVKDQNKPS